MQKGEHSSVVDAQVAMAVYRKCHKEWEQRLITKEGRKTPSRPQPRRTQVRPRVAEQ